MGVYYSSVAGYGFTLSTEEDDLAEIAVRNGIVTQEAVDDGDFEEYDLIEWVCRQYDLNYATAGNAYTGDCYYLIGLGITSSDIFGLVESTVPKPMDISDDATAKIQRAVDGLGLDKIIVYYTGMYVY